MYSSYLLLWFMKTFFIYTNGTFNSISAFNFINSWHRPCSHVPSWLYYSLFDNSWPLSLWFLNLMFWISYLLCKSIFFSFFLYSITWLIYLCIQHLNLLLNRTLWEFFAFLQNINFPFYFRIYISYWKSFMIINLTSFFS